MTESIPLRHLDGALRAWLHSELPGLTLTMNGLTYELPRDCEGWSLDGPELLMLGPNGEAYAVAVEVFVRNADREDDEH